MKKLLEKIRKILRDRRTRRFLTRFVSGLAAIVVFVTTYALVLPAITMELEANCGLETHQHNDSCYEKVLTCTIPESPGHTHTDACYQVDHELTCRTEEHSHDSGCYDEDGNLTCMLTEHKHTDNCYKETRNLVCGLEESKGHQHDASCYEKILTCGKEVHVHSTACYEKDPAEESAVAASTSSAGATSGASAVSAGASASTGAVSVLIDDNDAEDDSSGAGNGLDYGNENAGTGMTESAATGVTLADNDLDSYIPPLDPVNVPSVLDKSTSIYFHRVAEDEIVEDSTALTYDQWERIDKNTELGKNDLLRVYLAYTIPAGSLNATNPVARYRLPGNLHLTDAQVKAINENINAIAGQYVNYDSLEITDTEKYNAYLGIEAVEGKRKPTDDPDKYLRDLVRSGNEGGEYISAVVRVENVYDVEGTNGDKDAYLGQDLIFTFTPYSIEKNQHEYDASSKPTKAGEEISGWIAFDLTTEQIVWNQDDTEENDAKTAEIIFAEKDKELGIHRISTELELVNTAEDTSEEGKEDEPVLTDNDSDKPENADDSSTTAMADPNKLDENENNQGDNTEKDQVDDADNSSEEVAQAGTEESASAAENISYPAVSFDDSITVIAGSLSTDTKENSDSANTNNNRSTKIAVHVEADIDTFPEGTAMVLSAVSDDQMTTVAEAVEGAVDAPRTMGFHAVDISFRDTNGNEIEPLKPIKVSMTSDAIQRAVEDESTAPVVVHVEDGDPHTTETEDSSPDSADSSEESNAAEKKDSGETEKAEAPTATIIEANAESSDTSHGSADNTLTFEVGSFSIYAIVYTVDFHYEVNGKMYDFSIPGGGFVSFTDLVEVLGISKQDGTGDFSEEVDAENSENDGNSDDEFAGEEQGINAQDVTTDGSSAPLTLGDVEVSEETRKFVADVESITFSTPSLLSVSKVEDSTTVGAIKAGLGLECEYSAELTEEQIAKIDAQTVEAGDWALISVQPFMSEETLTVTMKNGDMFTIRVTDGTSYTITYVPGTGGKVRVNTTNYSSATNAITYSDENTYKESVNTAYGMADEGYVFSYWSVESGNSSYVVNWGNDGNSAYNYAIKPTVSGNITLKANFAQTGTRTVTFTVNNSEYGEVHYEDGDSTLYNGNSATLTTDNSGKVPYVVTPIPKRGYKFSYWQDASGNRYETLAAGYEALNGIQPTVASDTTFTAVFEEATGEVFVANGNITYVAGENGTVSLRDSLNAASVTGSKSDATGATAVPDSGYAFMGWYDEDDNPVYPYSTYKPGDLSDNPDKVFAKFVPVSDISTAKIHYSVQKYDNNWYGHITLNGSVSSVHSTAEDVLPGQAAKGCTATADNSNGSENVFAGWYEISADGTYKLVSRNANFVPEGYLIKDEATYVAMFRLYTKNSGDGGGIVSYNMNLAGVEVKWSGTSDFAWMTTVGGMAFADTKNGSYYKSADTFTVTDVVPEAEGYVFIGWYDKGRETEITKLGMQDTYNQKNATLRKPGDNLRFLYKGIGQRYTLEALWIKIDTNDVIVPYDESSHSLPGRATIVAGTILTDKNYAESAKTILTNAGYTYDSDLGQFITDVTYTLTQVDDERVSGSEQSVFEQTLPGVYTVDVKSAGTLNTRPYTIDKEAKLTILGKAITVNKVWNDEDDKDAARPDNLIVLLGKDKGSSNLLETSVSSWSREGNTWTATYTGLPFKAGDDLITYSATEPDAPSGYVQAGSTVKTTEQAYADVFGDETLTNDTFTITNARSKLKITKIWDDNLYTVNRPTSVSFKILKDGNVLKNGDDDVIITLTASDQVSGNSYCWETEAEIELTEGSTYTLQEINPDYHYDYEAESITVTFQNGEIVLQGDKNEDGALTASNHMRGSVTVTKEVVDKDGKKLETEDGYEILPDAEFTFKVYLKDSKGNEIKGKIKDDEDAIWYRMIDSDGAQMRDAKGDLIPDTVINSGDTIKLKAGQSLRLLNVPAGTKYKIEEVPGDIPNGYEHTGSDQYTYMDASLVSKTETADSDGYYSMRPNAWESVTVTNKYRYANVGVKKVDANDTTKLLSGAKFKLCTDAAGTTVAKDVDGHAFAEVTTVDGIASFGKVKDGTYYLIETVAPVGYTKAAPIEVIVENSKVSYRQANNVLSVTGEGVVYDAENNRYLLTVIEGPEEGQTVGTTDGSRQFSLDPHKQIDYLGDGGNDSDTLTSAHKNDTNAQQDMYRLYLDATMKKKTSNANIIFVEDWSSSMTLEDMGNGTRYENMQRALTQTDGFVDSVLQIGSGNQLSVVKFSDYRNTHNGIADGTGVIIDWVEAGDTVSDNNSVKESVKTTINKAYVNTPANTDGTQETVGGTDQSRWTNYEAGLNMVRQQINALSEDRRSYPTYVFFMSDGLPTVYGNDIGGYIPSWLSQPQSRWYGDSIQYSDAFVWGKEKYQNLVSINDVKGVLEGTKDAIDTFKNDERYADVVINAIGFSGIMGDDIEATNIEQFHTGFEPGNEWGVNPDPYPKDYILNNADYLLPSTNGKLQYNSVLRYLADGSGSYAQATNGQELAQALNNLLSIKTISQVSISDTLSDYVEMYVKSPDFAVTKTAANQDGTETKLTVTDKGDNTYAVTDGSKTVGTIVWNPTERRVALNFVDNLTYEDGDKYVLSFNVEASSKAYEEYAQSGYGSGEGDEGTDYGSNTTSEDADGFFSNKIASISYKYGDETSKRTEYYPYPVIQVGTTQLEVKKTWYPETPPEGVTSIRFNLYAQKPGGTKTQIMNPDMPDGSFVVRASDGWKLTIDKLNPKVLSNPATENAVYEPIVYTVEEVGSYDNYNTSYTYTATEKEDKSSFTNITSEFINDGNVHKYYVPGIADPSEGGQVKILNRSTPKGKVTVQKKWLDENDNDITEDASAHPDKIIYDVYRIRHVHEWVEKSRTEATESAPGKIVYVCRHNSSHTYEEEIPQLVHTHSYTKSTVLATCTEQGYDLHECTGCDASYKDNYVAALGHDWDAGAVTTEPTATSTGIRTYTCNNDNSHTYTEEIPKLVSTVTVNYHLRSLYNDNTKVTVGSYTSDGIIKAQAGGEIKFSCYRINNNFDDKWSYGGSGKRNITKRSERKDNQTYYYYEETISVVEGNELTIYINQDNLYDFKIEADPAVDEDLAGNTNLLLQSVKKLFSAPRKATGVSAVPSVTGYAPLDKLISQVGYEDEDGENKYYAYEKYLAGVELTSDWIKDHEVELEDEEGNAYTYYIVETAPSIGWTTAYSGQENGLSENDKVVITNKKVPLQELTFEKVWRDTSGTDSSEWPSGKTITVQIWRDGNVEFLKYEIAKSDLTVGNEISAYGDNDNAKQKLLVTANSPSGYAFKLSGLPNGYTYTVSEETVDGYQPPKYFNSDGTQAMGATQIGDGGTIANDQAGYELPSTGGPGTRLFTILGSILVCIAGALLVRRRRRTI